MKLKKEVKSFHIGKLIRAQLKKTGMSVYGLAGKLSISQQAVYYLLKKRSLDVEMLQKISIALDYDFFQHYLGFQKINGDDCGLSTFNAADVQRDLSIARKEIEVVLKHNTYLKEIILLMDSKMELPPARKFKYKYKSAVQLRKFKPGFKTTTPVSEDKSEVSPSRFIHY